MRIFCSGLARRARLGLIVGLMMAPCAPVLAEGDNPGDLQSLTLEAREAYRSGNLIGALTLSQRIAAVTGRQFGETHIRYAQALNNVALFQDLNGALAEASTNYRRAIGIVQAQVERHDALLADLKNNLAAVVLQQCRMGEARGLYADALKLAEANFGSYHPETELVRANVDRLDRFAAGRASRAQAAEFGQLLKSCMS